MHPQQVQCYWPQTSRTCITTTTIQQKKKEGNLCCLHFNFTPQWVWLKLCRHEEAGEGPVRDAAQTEDFKFGYKSW